MSSIREEVRHYGHHKVVVFWLKTAEQGEIAVTRLAPTTGKVRAPIVMLPGMFSNRRFWLSDKGVGLAAYLCEQGFDCWMMERRGLGDSGKQGYARASLKQCIQYDLPAVQALVAQHNPQAAFYMGHSFGGVINASSLAQGYLAGDKVAGLVNFSSQLTVGKHFLNPPLSALIYGSTALLRHFPSRQLGMGPENEPPETMRDCARLVSWAKRKNGNNYWSGFDNIIQPVLAFGSVGDTVDPAPGCQYLVDKMASNDKSFILLGKAHGHRKDYDHVGMVVSKDAAKEIWPIVTQWLTAKSGDN